VPADRSTDAATWYHRRAVSGEAVETTAAPARIASAPVSSSISAKPAPRSSAQVPMTTCGIGDGRTGTRVG
jgi:hypothetical protein